MGYYDFNDTIQCGSLEDLLYIRDISQRKLSFNGDIEPDTIFDPIRHILQFNKEDEHIPPKKRKPILLYLTSDGGDIDAGFALIDAIMASKTPVYTINLGWQYSMGFLIGITGHKRFATRNAKYLIHDGFTLIASSGSKARDIVQFHNRENQRMRDLILEKTKITEEEYEKNAGAEWYLFADEAKERGIVDYIIGKDCSLDEII